MKEKIKRISIWFLNNWRVFIRIGVVIWAIQGMYKITIVRQNLLYMTFATKGTNMYLVAELFYFLSAVLILYLLREHENRN